MKVRSPIGPALLAAFSLLFFCSVGAVDALSGATRFLVISICQALGFAASDHGASLSVGPAVISWSRDCAGLNVLGLLVLLVFWTHRQSLGRWKFWLHLGLAVPLAIVSNVARVLSIVAYRVGCFPAVESPQAHYLLCFLWILPAVAVLGWSFGILEPLYLAVAFALLSPLPSAPGGWAMLSAAFALLASRRFSSTASNGALALWGMLGFLIRVTSTESLWLPWLFCCPVFAPKGWWRRGGQWVLLASTVSLVAMRPWIWLLLAPALVYEALAFLKSTPATEELAPSLGWRSPALAILLFLPFLEFLGVKEASQPVPKGAVSFSPGGYSVPVPGQQSCQVTWYNSQGGGRHHTLAVCMRFRGVTLHPVSGSVMTDGRNLYREFFVVQGRLLTSYSNYLMATALPFTSVGAHVIVSVPVRTPMSAGQFEQTAATLAAQAVSAASSTQ